MSRRNNNQVQEVIESEASYIEDRDDLGRAEELFEETIDQESETVFGETTEETTIVYPIYQIADKFTADDLYDTKGKQHEYDSASNARRAQLTGKFTLKAEKTGTAKRTGAPRKTGTATPDKVETPNDFDSWSKAAKARFFVNAGCTMGDTARFMGVRFQQVFQAVAYGKAATASKEA